MQYDISTLSRMCGYTSVSSFAEACGIEADHLYSVHQRRAKMTADDFFCIWSLCKTKIEDISPENIYRYG